MSALLAALGLRHGLAGCDGLGEQASDHLGYNAIVCLGDGFDLGLEFGIESDRQVLAGCHVGDRNTAGASVVSRALIRATLDHMRTHESTS